MLTSDFDYDLPPELIAQEPAPVSYTHLSSVMVASLPNWPFSILVFTSSSVNESRRANSSLPVLPMVLSASSAVSYTHLCCSPGGLFR